MYIHRVKKRVDRITPIAKASWQHPLQRMPVRSCQHAPGAGRMHCNPRNSPSRTPGTTSGNWLCTDMSQADRSCFHVQWSWPPCPSGKAESPGRRWGVNSGACAFKDEVAGTFASDFLIHTSSRNPPLRDALCSKVFWVKKPSLNHS